MNSTFFLAKNAFAKLCALARTFYEVQLHSFLLRNEVEDGYSFFPLRHSHLRRRFCGVILYHLDKGLDMWFCCA